MSVVKDDNAEYNVAWLDTTDTTIKQGDAKTDGSTVKISCDSDEIKCNNEIFFLAFDKDYNYDLRIKGRAFIDRSRTHMQNPHWFHIFVQ